MELQVLAIYKKRQANWMLKQISIVILILFVLNHPTTDIRRMNRTSFTAEITSIDSILTEINDTIPNKTLLAYCDKNGFPVKYSRNIVTDVCIEGECRLVAIQLFWNVTGRYLGFELPEGEFLSKNKHQPFVTSEYDRLHEILAEANSPLVSYTVEELVPKKDTLKLKVDAVSSATIAAVLDHIVEGAVYTTYTLWHIVYGPTKREIETLTTKKLDAALCLLILNSNNIKDQVWVLNHISANMKISEGLQKKLMELISGNDIYLAERALNALKTQSVSHDIQTELAQVFKNSGFLQKRLIIQKYSESDRLYADVAQILSSELNSLNGTLVKNILELYKLQNIHDSYTISEVAKLLKNENRYISSQAINFLENISAPDKKTMKAITKYKKRTSN